MVMKGKVQVDFLDGTPEKRLFLSIISDYDLTTGLCELIDNALDFWVRTGKKGKLAVDVDLDTQAQLITVTDDAGGVEVDDLRLLVAPGASGNDPTSEIIGIFGVGGKRASVALGRLVEIRTRAKTKTYQIDLDEEWTRSEDWNLAYYEVSPIPKGKTIVQVSKLRQQFSEDDIDGLKAHCSAVYARFIKDGVDLSLNGEILQPASFDNWAYPKEHPPVKTKTTLALGLPESVDVYLKAGLIHDRDAEGDNYGVYIYCNDRLISKELRNRDVGYYVTSEAGVPHPDASLCRVIVDFNGPAEQMPWNSSKSGISAAHPAFSLVRPKIIELTSHFSSLSRRLKYDWDNSVFPYRKGQITDLGAFHAKWNQRLNLPSLPRVRKLPIGDSIRTLNKTLIEKQPWVLGLVESVAAVDHLGKSRLHTQNRIKLIVLDSSFEIAMKEYIAKNPTLYPPHQYTDSQLQTIMSKRTLAIKEVRKHVDIPQSLIDKAQHYYGLRNKLIHERTTADVSDQVIEDYENVVRKILKKLFKVRFPAD
ncbi:MAG: ATP-binding protein [Novosphingobium sp.]|nr:ATP-binding protein [Novosphingobium sp.]MBO9603944.1 ATP-binding protein [Novosphingobium sp.]